jgi:hypothetical protein
MPTPAQIAANQQNAQRSTGPVSETGKESSSKNARTHGLAGGFAILAGENRQEYVDMLNGLLAEHAPTTETESLLVHRMAQHIWISQRAINLQQLCLDPDTGICDSEYRLALYLRYQTTHDRAFHKCLSQLLKLKAEKRKTAIGFVSQKPATPCRAEQSPSSQSTPQPQQGEPASQIGFVSQPNQKALPPQSKSELGFVSQNDSDSNQVAPDRLKDAA